MAGILLTDRWRLDNVTFLSGRTLEKVHGLNWPWSNGFIRSLPAPKFAWHYNSARRPP